MQTGPCLYLNGIFQNKDFIYRGQEFEKISTFTQRLATEFPHAQVLTSNSREPDEALKSEDGQFVQICCVKAMNNSAVKESSAATIDGYEIPEKIRKFHQVNNVDKFQYDRPYHRGNKDRDNEFKVTLSLELQFGAHSIAFFCHFIFILVNFRLCGLNGLLTP